MAHYKHILLVDDHGITREGAALHLRTIDPEIVTYHAKMPAEALQVLSQQQIDLIFLDLKFADAPGTPGLELLQQLKDSPDYDHIPVIIMSGERLDRNGIEGLLEMKAAGFISKQSTDSADIFKIALLNIEAGAVFIHGVRTTTSPHSIERRTASSLGLKPSHQRVLVRLVKGMPYKRIARELNLAEATIKEYVSDLLKIFKVPSSKALIYEIARAGIGLEDA